MTAKHIINTDSVYRRKAVQWFLLTALLMTLAALIVITTAPVQNAKASTAVADEATGLPAHTSPQLSARKACPDNHTVVWLDATTVQCLKEIQGN